MTDGPNVIVFLHTGGSDAFFLQENNRTEKDYSVNTLSLGTIAALVGSVLVKMMY